MNAHLSSPETICLQCGDRGFTNAFVYCVKCLDVAVHRYCLDVLPEAVDEFVPWVCDDCDVVQNQPAICKYDSFRCQTRDSTTSEHIIGYSEVGTAKNDIVAVNMEETVYEGGPYDAGVELRLVEHAESACEFCPRRMNDELVIVSSASERKRCEESSYQHLEEEKIMQHDKLSVDTPTKESMKQQRGAIRESTVDEGQHRLGNNSLKGPHEQFTNIDISECAELVSDSKLSTEVRENKLLESENQCSDMGTEGRGINPSNHYHENRKSEVSEERTSASHEMSNLCKESSKDLDVSLRVECHIRAEPVIIPVWRGSFSIWNRNGDILHELVAHISCRACDKVYEEACLFQSVLHLEILPRSDVWPKYFETSDPVENIALYFFPSEIRGERVFEHLVDEMVNKALAMRAIVQNAELLVFTSTELPIPYWRFQDKYYLWGVFRQKQHQASISRSYRGESRYNPIMTEDLLDGTGFSGEMMAIRNPLGKFLGENRLKGPNYADWKRNLNIILTDEKLIHVLDEEPPVLPADEACQDVKDAYKLWCDHDSLAKCYILASLENKFQKQHGFLTTSKDIMASLKEMFDQQNCSAIQNAMTRLICSRMIQGAPIHDHIGKMIGCINELEMLGAEMDKGIKMDEILSSLPNAFIQFVLNVNKKNLVMTLFELRNMLQRAKDWIKNDKPVIMIPEVGQTPNPNSSKRKRKPRNKKSPKQDGFKKSGKDKSKQSCFHCGKRGHWKRNCREYLASMKN